MRIEELPRTAKEARRVGAKYYFTGLPCVRGHISRRYAHGSCVTCKEEDRERNREKNAAYFRKWREENPERTREYHRRARERGYDREYYQKNRDRQIAAATEWRLKNPERARELVREYYQRNKADLLRKSKEYYQRNKERILEQDREYRRARRKQRALASRLWRKNNPEHARELHRNKKARRRGAEGFHTAKDVRLLIKRQKNRCAECKTCLSKGYHVDHVMPIIKGGTNWPSNLQILCPPCNLQKHAADPIEFARRKGRLL